METTLRDRIGFGSLGMGSLEGTCSAFVPGWNTGVNRIFRGILEGHRFGISRWDPSCGLCLDGEAGRCKSLFGPRMDRGAVRYGAGTLPTAPR